MSRRFSLLLVYIAVIRLLRAQQLLQNGGFENADVVGTWGHAWGFKMQREASSNAPEGGHYLRVTNRTQSWQGAGQDVAMKPNTNYNVSCFFQILNNNSKLYQGIRFTVAYQWDADSSSKSYYDVAERHMLTADGQWHALGGDFTTPSRNWHSANMYIQGPDPGISFLMDGASLTPVHENVHWKQEANDRIEQLRKTNMTLSIEVPSNLDPQLVELEVNLKKHLFGFGSVVRDTEILVPQFKRYQDLFYYFFNWGTVGSYKWRYNQGTVAVKHRTINKSYNVDIFSMSKGKQHPDYNHTLKVTDELIKHNMHVRGHNMFWGVGNNNPAAVRSMNAQELEQTIQTRINFLTRITRGKIDHWDVNNELLHGQVYEQITGDPNYSEQIYTMVHNADPHPLLFLNDYDVIAVGANTLDYRDQAQHFKEHSHLDALGLQGHFRDFTAPDPTLLMSRLDILSQVGLPLWITEMTLKNADENARADWFETAYRVFFSHPSVEGVILWGFWDKGDISNSFLVNGNNLYINEAGKRYLQLVKKEWSTNLNITMSNAHEELRFRVFQGDYEVIIRYNGKPIKVQHFSVGKTPTTANVLVPSSTTNEITLPTELPENNPVVHHHHVYHNGKRVIGRSSSRSQSATPICTSRYSASSEIGDDKTTSVHCDTDEVMTGCSMITEDRSSVRDGEKFDMKNGNVVCSAVNAWRSTAPVQAVARCCKLRQLDCEYLMAGPSGHNKDDQIQLECPAGKSALGCTSYTYFGNMDGAYSSISSCFAQADGIEGGVFTYGACCSAPNMNCTTVKSAESDLRHGSIASTKCPNGAFMAGCSVYTEDGNTAGARITDNGGVSTCSAMNGKDKYPGEMGAVATATCCTV